MEDNILGEVMVDISRCGFTTRAKVHIPQEPPVCVLIKTNDPPNLEFVLLESGSNSILLVIEAKMEEAMSTW